MISTCAIVTKNLILIYFQFCLLFRHWLTAREEMIFVKGKGNMQTYWCEPQNENTSSLNDDLYDPC